jgi:hypothetical protein
VHRYRGSDESYSRLVTGLEGVIFQIFNSHDQHHNHHHQQQVGPRRHHRFHNRYKGCYYYGCIGRWPDMCHRSCESQELSVISCGDWKTLRMNESVFFEKYCAKRPKEMFKLKDWPPTRNFEEALPDYCEVCPACHMPGQYCLLHQEFSPAVSLYL